MADGTNYPGKGRGKSKRLDDTVGRIDFSIGAESAGSVIAVTCQLKQLDGESNLARFCTATVFVGSDNSGTVGETTLEGSGPGTGTLLVEHTSDAVWYCMTDSDGLLVVSVDDDSAGAVTSYLYVQVGDRLFISPVLTFV